SQVQNAAPVVRRVWRAIILSGTFAPGAKKASVLAQPAALKGDATLIHQLRKRFGKRPDVFESALANVLSVITPDNELWKLPTSGSPALWEVLDAGYQDLDRRTVLQNSRGSNVWDSVGSTITLGDSTQRFGITAYRFGAKTNDIRRVVADVVRW